MKYIKLFLAIAAMLACTGCQNGKIPLSIRYPSTVSNTTTSSSNSDPLAGGLANATTAADNLTLPSYGSTNGTTGTYTPPVNATGDPIADYVTQLYARLLNRAPDTASFNYWVAGAKNGSLTEQDLLFGFLASPEYQNLHPDNTDFVRSLYLQVLGRQPDPAGLAGWVSQLSSGTSRGVVVSGFLQSDEYMAMVAAALPVPVDRNVEFVKRAYLALLGRAAEPPALQDWVNRMNSAEGVTQNDLTYFILTSDEYNAQHADNTDFIVSLYRNLLRREPDPVGLSTFQTYLNSEGWPRYGIVAEILLSAEYTSLAALPMIPTGPNYSPGYAGGDRNQIFVKRAYLTILGRLPDPAGAQQHQNLLATGAITQVGLVASFLASAEYTQKHPDNTDFVNSLYHNLLRRHPSQGEAAGWVNLMAGGWSRVQVIQGFQQSVEYQSLSSL